MEGIENQSNYAEAAREAARVAQDNIMNHWFSLKDFIVSSAIFKPLIAQKVIFTPDFAHYGLGSRPILPIYFLPLLFLTVAGTSLIPGKKMRVAATLPIVLTLALGRPFFTAGSPSGDYDSASPFLGLLLAYIDFYIISELQGQVLYDRVVRAGTGIMTKGKSKVDDATLVKRFGRQIRLISTLRGIGWNWEVKNVPPNPDLGLSDGKFVAKHSFRFVRSIFWSRFSLYVLGACKTFQIQEFAQRHMVYVRILDAAVGWCAACWTYHGLVALYSLCAALTVALGMCETWEWPPVVGNIRDAWSVRQMWGVVWHQNLRRRIEMISIPLTRLLRLRKGTLGSKYMQLFIGFAVSTLIHEWSSFASIGRDSGEFKFFMSQPIIIEVEDFVKWGWRRFGGVGKNDRMAPFEMIAGWVWTFCWFSYCLVPFAQ